MNALWTLFIALILFNIVPTLKEIRDELHEHNRMEQQCPKAPQP